MRKPSCFSNSRNVFLVSLIWTIAGLLETDDRKKVDHKLRALTKGAKVPIKFRR